MAAIGVRLGYFSAGLAGLVGVIGSLSAATTLAGPVSEKPEKRGSPTEETDRPLARPRLTPVFALDVGLAGPPLVAKDGTWWISGRDGQVARMARNDTLHWAIGVGASVAGGATLGENGLLFVPTVKNSIVAMEPRGTPRWRSRAPWGIDGPLAWVPTQGLVFVSNDQRVQWLSMNARLLQRSKLSARRTAGPVALGTAAALGTESGALLVWITPTRRFELQLESPVHVIVGASQRRVLALAGTQAYLIAGSSVQWQRPQVIAVGVAVTDQPDADVPSRVVVAREQGEIQWLDAQGDVVGACKAPWSKPLRLAREIAASNECAWLSSSSGTLWQCCTDGSVRELALTRAPLLQPVLDWPRQRLLVASSEREIWSIPLPARVTD